MWEETLEEWAKHYHSNSDMSETFRAQALALKKTHEQGYYVVDFNLNQILVGKSESYGKYVQFKKVAPFPKKEEESLKLKNVKTECFLEIGLYSSMFSDLSVQFNPTFLKENFDRFAIFLPEEEFKYYKKVFVYDSMDYLCDFLAKNAEMQVNKMEKELESEGGRSFNKSTPVGRAVSQNMKESFVQEPSSQAAFATTLVLSFVVITLSLLIPLMAFLFGVS